ncbi:MAG: flagellar brake protein [Planctomycetota bacterium]|jgi:c-di-GMP-binding flagellar brake protein YcgR
MPVDALDMSEGLKKQILLDLCQRNHHGELVYLSENSKMLNAKIRFLGSSLKSLVIDKPSITSKASIVPIDGFVHVEFSWEKQRYTFVSKVQARTRWLLNNLVTVDAICLAMPKKLTRNQRRKCYRLGLAHLATNDINLLPVDKTRNSITGKMINVSEGGASILIDKQDASELVENDLYLAAFSLPDESNQIVSYYIAGTISRTQDIHYSKHIRVGIKWDLNPGDREIQAGLGKFIVAEQLRMLRRKQKVALGA